LLDVTDRIRKVPRMFKKAVQRGRSERGDEAYSFRYVEPPSEARTKLADFFNILLKDQTRFGDERGRSWWPSLFCVL
jgi:hypothetical protein